MNPNPTPNLSPPIVLLDLNFTLIDNCDEHQDIPFPQRIDTHVYRAWLIELLVASKARIFLVTARPERHRERTLAHIIEKTGWAPERYYGNVAGEPPPQCKERVLREHIFPEFGEATISNPSPFLGIESNPRTRAMYARHLIPSLPCQELSKKSNLQQVWKSRATGLFATSP